MECLSVNNIQHLISLQWNVKAKDISSDLISHKNDNPSDAPEKTIRSAICRIKGMEDSIFYLALTNKLNMLCKGQPRWSYHLIYAFAVVKDRGFAVKPTDELGFLKFLTLDYLDSTEEVSFHCKVRVTPPKTDSTSAESSLRPLVDLKEQLNSDGQACANLEDIGLPHCKFDGEIPDFSVDLAEELISDEDTNSVLKVLAIEYLIENIKVKNVTDILKIAIDHDLKVLQKHCFEFLRKCTIQNDNYSSSTSSDDDYEMSGV